MESSPLTNMLIAVARFIKRAVIELAKVFFLVISIAIPMFIVVIPYCYYMAANMAPANTTERLIATMAEIMFGASLMWGIPMAAYWLYGRKLEARLWR